MGWFDSFRRKTPAPGGPPAGAGPGSPKKALAQAQARRRAGGPLTGRSGKPRSMDRFGTYERLEQAIAVEVGRFPWSAAEAQQVLAGRGIPAAHVAAYLRSEAARRLLQ